MLAFTRDGPALAPSHDVSCLGPQPMCVMGAHSLGGSFLHEASAGGTRPYLSGREACVLRKKPTSARANWARRLPHTIFIPEVMAVSTLADARTLVERHLPADHRAKNTWRHVSTRLIGAAQGVTDTRDVEIALRMVLAMEGVECRPK